MGLLNFSTANCKSCYKCIRSCPVKAIKMKNDQAEIVEERCIACGQCLIVCPQHARDIESDLTRVKKAISNKKKMIASVAPSFPAAMDFKNPLRFVEGLKRLGFEVVEETSVGAELVVDLYKDYIQQNKNKSLITTCCPSANYLIQKYFPSLIDNMIPIVSPMIAHGKILKHTYGMDSFTVFIGPCTAKKYESIDFEHSGIIDSVLTFEEVMDWFKEDGIDILSLEGMDFDRAVSSRGSRFPIAGGILSNYGRENDDLRLEKISVHGIDECIEIFESIQNGDLYRVLVEADTCKGSCIGGPGMPRCEEVLYKKYKRVKEYVKSKPLDKVNSFDEVLRSSKFTKLFFDKSNKKQLASEEEITKILQTMGKFKKADELNCGGCGYNTCREKAQAVFEGMAEVNMCIHFIRGKAESLTNVIFEHSPNAIILLDDEYRVKEFNPTSEKIFNISALEAKDKPISAIIDDEAFRSVGETRRGIFGRRVYYPEYGVVLLENIVYIENQNVILGIMNDVTLQEKNQKELAKVREKTLDAAQDVIEKQMRVAQEIASLLGETTAETKMILTKLKNITIGEVGDIK